MSHKFWVLLTDYTRKYSNNRGWQVMVAIAVDDIF